MWNESYIIVDDIFSGFARENPEVLTRTGLYTKLLTEPVDVESINLVLGQGVNVFDIKTMVETQSLDSQRFQCSNEARYIKASQNNTHKYFSQNILVSVARRIEEHHFEMDLMLDGANEFFGDHMTGQHIQGMAIIEAARQAFLSVTEQFFLSSRNQKSYFVINSIDTKYQRFLFPVAAKVSYFIDKLDVSDDRLIFEASIDIIQDDKVCASIAVGFTVFEHNSISEKENRAASKVAQSLLGHHHLAKAVA